MRKMLTGRKTMIKKAGISGVRKVMNGISITKKIKKLMKEGIQFILQSSIKNLLGKLCKQFRMRTV